MKYIFVAGAPGSKWSSVVKNIYYSPSIDRSDSSQARQYYHDTTGQSSPMHLGAYWDPGMEFDIPEDCSGMSKTTAESIFDQPFSGVGTRIIKSHVFCLPSNIEWLRHTWPGYPIVLVYRDTDACIGWWYRCGGWDIDYPNYHAYYQNNANLVRQVQRQNAGILVARSSATARAVENNRHLCKILDIYTAPDVYWQDYAAADIEVTVI